MTKSLIIFDMDGTLIDSSGLLANAINHVRSKLHLPPMPSQQIIGHINNHQVNPALYFYEVEHFEPIHEQWFSQYYSAHHDHELVVYEGVVELLTWLKEQGNRIALATNAHRVSTLESLQYLEIESFFDAVVCHDDVPNPKPAPDMLNHVLAQLQSPLDSAIFIGDGPRDEEAAQAAGMDYVMVDWGFTDHQTGKRVIQNIHELKKELGRVVKVKE
jgi:phosphoglycolate phosphatase